MLYVEAVLPSSILVFPSVSEKGSPVSATFHLHPQLLHYLMLPTWPLCLQNHACTHFWPPHLPLGHMCRRLVSSPKFHALAKHVHGPDSASTQTDYWPPSSGITMGALRVKETSKGSPGQHRPTSWSIAFADLGSPQPRATAKLNERMPACVSKSLAELSGNCLVCHHGH